MAELLAAARSRARLLILRVNCEASALRGACGCRIYEQTGLSSVSMYGPSERHGSYSTVALREA